MIQDDEILYILEKWFSNYFFLIDFIKFMISLQHVNPIPPIKMFRCHAFQSTSSKC